MFNEHGMLNTCIPPASCAKITQLPQGRRSSARLCVFNNSEESVLFGAALRCKRFWGKFLLKGMDTNLTPLATLIVISIWNSSALDSPMVFRVQVGIIFCLELLTSKIPCHITDDWLFHTQHLGVRYYQIGTDLWLGVTEAWRLTLEVQITLKYHLHRSGNGR